MRIRSLLLIALPALITAADDSSSSGTSEPGSPSRYSAPSPEPESTRTPVSRPVEDPQAPPPKAPLDANRSAKVWRLQLGYGFTHQTMSYHAEASADAPTLPGYGSTSSSATPGVSSSSLRLDVGPMYGVHPASRGDDSGFIWGIDLGLASFAKKTVSLPATDADTSGTSQNGTSYQASTSIQTFAVGMPIGWAWDLSPHLSIETLAFFHLGILHTKYTSGENLVYGRNAPLDLYSNDLYNPYVDVGAKVNLAYRFISGWEALVTLGYLYGQSLSGTVKDSVTYYQGAANAQTGSYKEKVSYRVSGAFLDVGAGWSF